MFIHRARGPVLLVLAGALLVQAFGMAAMLLTPEAQGVLGPTPGDPVNSTSVAPWYWLVAGVFLAFGAGLLLLGRRFVAERGDGPRGWTVVLIGLVAAWVAFGPTGWLAPAPTLGEYSWDSVAGVAPRWYPPLTYLVAGVEGLAAAVALACLAVAGRPAVEAADPPLAWLGHK